MRPLRAARARVQIAQRLAFSLGDLADIGALKRHAGDLALREAAIVDPQIVEVAIQRRVRAADGDAGAWHGRYKAREAVLELTVEIHAHAISVVGGSDVIVDIWLDIA